MSKIKDLRNNSDNVANLVDFISLLCPENKESKYVPLFLKFMKETSNYNVHIEEIIKTISENFNIPREKVTKFTSLQLVICYLFFHQMFNENDLKKFQKFCEYNEKNMIPNNDLTKYKSFSDIKNSVDLAEIKMIEKEMEKSIKTIYRDDEWFILRPLTYQASKKYGWNTKWCTSSEDTNDQFINYSRRGILIYTINTKTGLKVACFRERDEITTTPEFSFWNQLDHRIDSMQSGIPLSILSKILDEIEKNPITNKELAEKMCILDINGNHGRKQSYSLTEQEPTDEIGNEQPIYDNGEIELVSNPTNSFWTNNIVIREGFPNESPSEIVGERIID